MATLDPDPPPPQNPSINNVQKNLKSDVNETELLASKIRSRSAFHSQSKSPPRKILIRRYVQKSSAADKEVVKEDAAPKPFSFDELAFKSTPHSILGEQVNLSKVQEIPQGVFAAKDSALSTQQVNPNASTSEGVDVSKPNNPANSVSFAKIVSDSSKKTRVNLEYFPPSIDSNGDIAPVELPMALCEEGSKPYVNTLYGYFIGAKMAFPYMQDHLQKRWAKYGVGDISRNGKGFYFINFNNEQGMWEVLEGGPWMISNVPFFIQRWYPGVNLTKEQHDKVPVWVKIHDVPLEAWSLEGIARISSSIGKPLDMDSYTEHKCNAKSGRSAFARVLIEMSADREWKNSVIVNTWNLVTKQPVSHTLEVKYGWTPQRCTHCKFF